MADSHDDVVVSLRLSREDLTITAPAPALVHQNNVEAVIGIPRRQFLRDLRAPGFPLETITIGKLRLVDREAYLAHLRSKGQPPTRHLDEPPKHAADDIDRLLASSNIVRAGGGR